MGRPNKIETIAVGVTNPVAIAAAISAGNDARQLFYAALNPELTYRSKPSVVIPLARINPSPTVLEGMIRHAKPERTTLQAFDWFLGQATSVV